MIDSSLNRFNSLIRTTGFQLFMFLGIQFVGLLLTYMHLHTMQTTERQFAEMRLSYQNSVLRSNVIDTFDVIQDYAEAVEKKITGAIQWDEISPEEGHKLLKSFITVALPMVHHIQIFGADGIQKLSSVVHPAPNANIQDRPYFIEMRDKGTDQMHFGPYVGRSFGTMTYSVLERLYYKGGKFAGVLLLSVDSSTFDHFCKAVLASDNYDAFVVTKEGKILVWCGFDKARKDWYGKDFKDTKHGKGIDLSNVKSKETLENDTHGVTANVIPGNSGLLIVTTVSKQGAYDSMSAMIWQNYMLFMVVLLSQSLCFMMFNNSIKLRKQGK